MKKRTIENIQPEQMLNSEQQMIVATSRQTIANTLVSRIYFFLSEAIMETKVSMSARALDDTCALRSPFSEVNA
jgi:hypothetical protein